MVFGCFCNYAERDLALLSPRAIGFLIVIIGFYQTVCLYSTQEECLLALMLATTIGFRSKVTLAYYLTKSMLALFTNRHLDFDPTACWSSLLIESLLALFDDHRHWILIQ